MCEWMDIKKFYLREKFFFFIVIFFDIIYPQFYILILVLNSNKDVWFFVKSEALEAVFCKSCFLKFR